MYITYIIIGICGGVLGGMGMGGGTVLIPLLSIVLGINQHSAQAINLISFIPMAFIAIILHAKNNLIKYKIVWPIIFAGIFACIIGSVVAELIEKNILKKIFGIFLILLAIFDIIGGLLQKKR